MLAGKHYSACFSDQVVYKSDKCICSLIDQVTEDYYKFVVQAIRPPHVTDFIEKEENVDT